MAKAVKYRWDMNNQDGMWTIYRTLQISQNDAETAIKMALAIGPVKDFYRYEIYDNNEKHLGNILSSDANLFDRLH